MKTLRKGQNFGTNSYGGGIPGHEEAIIEPSKPDQAS